MKSPFLINYIITAHKNPEQLNRLIKTLNTSNCKFYIHIDLKQDIEPFKKLISQNNVIFIKERVNCLWGDYSQVKATLKLLNNIIKNETGGRVLFLSGQDYPIKNKIQIENYLRKFQEYDFISYTLNPIPEDSDIFKQRVKKYRFNLSNKRGDHIILSPFLHLSLKQLKKILKLIYRRKVNPIKFWPLFSLKRKQIFHYNYKGSNWWSLKYDTVQKLLDYYNHNKKNLDHYYKYTHCADELFFHTILKDIMKKDTDIQILPNLHFVDWSRKNITLPVTFEKKDLDLLINQPCNKLFARKFDENFDKDILDLIDKKITKEQP